MITVLLIIFALLVVVIVLFVAAWIDPKNQVSECGCKLQCGYCKELEASEKKYSIKETCKHPNILLRVLEISGTCETIIEVCADCDEPLSEPKTECR